MEFVCRLKRYMAILPFCAARAGLATLGLFAFIAPAYCAEPGQALPVRVALYDVAPYGGQSREGLFSGASVDLWRRVAEHLHWQYELTLVAQIDDVLSGLEHGSFDVGIGAITITPERLARVDFSYPTHRSGVAAAFAKRTGVLAAFYDYGAIAGELSFLILAIVIFLAVIGVLMWWFEHSALRKSDEAVAGEPQSSVTSWHEGIYWAVVTMTTVGYGDKTPKTHLGRALAVGWMIGSLVLVSLLTTNLVARMTADRVEGATPVRTSDLMGRRLAAVSASSGAEYLEDQHFDFQKFNNLTEALEALAAGKTDAVVNSVGALQYLVNTRFSGAVASPRGLLAPAYMAFALPINSALKKPLDRSLIAITASPEWRSVEESYFGR